MDLSSEMRKLENKWNNRGMGSGWPKFLESLKIKGLRGWTGQEIKFPFPIIAIVGENGSGKSTILQCASSIYKSPDTKRFASDFFPKTIWDELEDNIKIEFTYKQGINSTHEGSIRKPTKQWLGNPKRPERIVVYRDLSRVQPVSARTGYAKLADAAKKETHSKSFEKNVLDRFSTIIGKKFESVRMALTDADPNREVPVVTQAGNIKYSGYHQGAGENVITELLQEDLKRDSLLLIDEIETSLHPRAQRRLIRDLAEKCRQLDLQILCTTHSQHILEELPLEGRLYIMATTEKMVVRGITPEFAMTQMDDLVYSECDVYVEDPRSATLLNEILAKHSRDNVLRCRFIPYGSGQVGCSLGQMTYKNLFPRKSCVFLDGDHDETIGCNVLPGGDSPERVVFSGMEKIQWQGIAERIGRTYTEVADACQQALTYSNPKEWIRFVAEKLVVSSDGLWQVLCSVWVDKILSNDDALKTIKPIDDCLTKLERSSSPPPPPTTISFDY